MIPVQSVHILRRACALKMDPLEGPEFTFRPVQLVFGAVECDCLTRLQNMGSAFIFQTPCPFERMKKQVALHSFPIREEGAGSTVISARGNLEGQTDGIKARRVAMTE